MNATTDEKPQAFICGRPVGSIGKPFRVTPHSKRNPRKPFASHNRVTFRWLDTGEGDCWPLGKFNSKARWTAA